MKHYAAILLFLAFSATVLRADQLTVLSSARTFAVLGASTVTNAGTTTISGDLGLAPGTSITGFPPGIVSSGMVHANDPAAIAAQADALLAYNALAAMTFTHDITGQDLGGMTLTPGIYFFATTSQLTGDLILDFQHQTNADIIFQIGTTLTTSVGSTVTIINRGTNNNVFYQVGTSATLGTNSVFQGDVLAQASITLNGGVVIPCGSVLAINGAVTLDTNSIQNCSTTGSDITPYTPTRLAPSAVPEPSSFALLSTGTLGLAGLFKRRLSA